MRVADRLDSDRATLVLKGADGNDKLPGSQWSDVLDGGRGIDWLEGLGGDDVYYVDNQGDAVREDSGEGLDTVISTATYRLAEGISVEILQAFPNSGRIGLTGNSFSNQIFGNESANRLDGGAGNDALNGGLGKDVFLFTTKLSKTGNVDHILDFRVVDDSIWLENSIFKGLGKAGSLTKPAKLDSDDFIVGNRAHDREDRIIYSKTTGSLYYDADGTGKAAQIKFAQLEKGLNIKASDFFAV
nr:calcium-binding protein [Microvirga terrestris]